MVGERHMCVPRAVVVVLLSLACFAQNQDQARSDQTIELAQKAALAAVNFQQGDAAGFARARTSFTDEGWKKFLKLMQPFLDAKGAPTFTSHFVAARDARIVSETDSVLRLRIPGKLTQSNQHGTTTYNRAALEISVRRNQTPVKIETLEQITCAKNSSACD